MFPRRYKLIRFHCESLGTSEHSPACEDVHFIALLEDEEGRKFERTKTILAYPRIMSDPEQFPLLIVAELKSLMLGPPPA